MGMRNLQFFQLVWGRDEDIHIPAIILVPAITPSSFKSLKYSPLASGKHCRVLWAADWL